MTYQLSIPGNFSPIVNAPNLASAIEVLPRHLRPQVVGGWELLNQRVIPITSGEIRVAFHQINQRLRLANDTIPVPADFKESSLWAEIRAAIGHASDQDELDECFAQAIRLVHEELTGDTIAQALRELTTLKIAAQKSFVGIAA